MSYADRNVAGPRVVAAVMVAIMVALLGYAFVTGLAFQYTKKLLKDLKAFDIEEPPPPPEEVPPPPPPPDTPIPPPPTQVVIPPSIVQTNIVTPPPPTFTPTPPPAPPPPTPPAPPPPPPAAPSKAAAAKGNPASWVTSDDYPSAARRNNEQGSVGIAFDVTADGRVANCSVTSSSGSSTLDSETCRLVMRRGRYSPALDAAGNPVPGGRKSLRFRWQLEE